jgi:3-hydroxyacyl-CoA dehydrogenase
VRRAPAAGGTAAPAASRRPPPRGRRAHPKRSRSGTAPAPPSPRATIARSDAPDAQDTATASSRTAFADFDLGLELDAAPVAGTRPAIRQLGVIGAGTMGGGIAALAASAGLPVVLLDIPAEGPDRSAIARGALQRLAKARPAAFMDAARAASIRTGNTEDDLQLLADCDLVVEVIIEQPRPKQQLFARLEEILKPTAIVSSNTSGIPMKVLTEGRSERFRTQFLGTHFFAPARYMHLLEIIPTPDTDPAVTAAVREFGERMLGKGIVVCKDAPGFVANRLGVYGMNRTLRAMDQSGLTIDEVDALTGPLLGRPKSATFRTGDLSGLDVLAHVSAGLAQTTGEDFDLPAWFHAMVSASSSATRPAAASTRSRGRTSSPSTRRPGSTARSSASRAPSSRPRSRRRSPSASRASRRWAASTATSSAGSSSTRRATRSRRAPSSPTTCRAWTARWSGATGTTRGRSA